MKTTEARKFLDDLPPWPWKKDQTNKFIKRSIEIIGHLCAELDKVPPPVSNEFVAEGCEQFTSQEKPLCLSNH